MEYWAPSPAPEEDPHEADVMDAVSMVQCRLVPVVTHCSQELQEGKCPPQHHSEHHSSKRFVGLLCHSHLSV